MKKKYYIISLVVIILLGSLFTALGSNMLFSDIANKDSMEHNTITVTIPASMMAVSFVIALFYVIRLQKNKEAFKKHTLLYLILMIVFNIIGVIGTFLSINVYHTLLSPYPFKGYLLIMLILEILIIGGSITSGMRTSSFFAAVLRRISHICTIEKRFERNQ